MSAWDRFIGALAGRPAIPVAIAVALAVGSAALARGIPFRSDATEHLPSVSPNVAAWLDLSRRFDAFNSLIIGLEEPTAPLTAEGLASVKRVTDALAALKAQGVLGVSSVTNVDSILEAEDGSLETELLVTQVPTDAAGLTALRARILADVEVSGALISRDQRGYMLLVRADPRHDTAELAQRVEKAVEANRGPLSAVYFGAPFFSAVITRDVYAQLPWLAPIFVGALLVLLAARARRAAVVALVLGSTGLTLLTWAGLVRVLGLSLSLTSLTALLALVAVAGVAFSRGLDARFGSKEANGNAFPKEVMFGLLAVGLASLSLRFLPIAFLAVFGTVLAVGALATALVGVLFFAPLACRLVRRDGPPPGVPTPRAPWVGALVALGVTAAGAMAASRAHFSATPQTMFTARDDVGRSLAFFDRRFGGPDFVQVDYRGDLRDPAVAARLLRLTDLLEGSPAFPDVRSVAQILGFLSKGFGGVHRVPPTRESLANLWFFLEGRPDVRNLASDARDEAMVVLRLPSRPERPMAELEAVVNAAVADSLQLGPAGTKRRLLALARSAHSSLTEEQVDRVLSAGGEHDNAALDAEVNARLKTWLASTDSPYQPTEAEWSQLEQALRAAPSGRTQALTAVAASFASLSEPTMAAQLVESIESRVKELRLALRAQALADALWTQPVPEALRARSQGAMADLLDPPHGTGDAATVVVSGLPVVAATLERDLFGGLWRALAALVGIGALVWLFAQRKPGAAVRTLLEAATTSALTLAVVTSIGPGVDSGSATLMLTPALVSLLASGSSRGSNLTLAFLGALGLSCFSLLLLDVLPVVRIGAAMGAGLVIAALVQRESGRFAGEARA